jgi:hypothetical protein
MGAARPVHATGFRTACSACSGASAGSYTTAHLLAGIMHVQPWHAGGAEGSAVGALSQN